ncbi:MAG: 30S ribosomal protein S16 [Patescibacteria group bacterium]
MLVIRLARHGRKNWPTYRLVLQEKEWSPSSKVIENLGNMDPHTNPSTVKLKTERINYWLKQGAQPSDTVHNLLVVQGILTGEKKRVVAQKKAAPVAVPAVTPAAAAPAEAA